MRHWGQAIHSMAKLSEASLKQIAHKAGYSEKQFYDIIKKKHVNTKVIEAFANACNATVTIQFVISPKEGQI